MSVCEFVSQRPLSKPKNPAKPPCFPCKKWHFGGGYLRYSEGNSLYFKKIKKPPRICRNIHFYLFTSRNNSGIPPSSPQIFCNFLRLFSVFHLSIYLPPLYIDRKVYHQKIVFSCFHQQRANPHRSPPHRGGSSLG